MAKAAEGKNTLWFQMGAEIWLDKQGTHSREQHFDGYNLLRTNNCYLLRY